MVVAGEFAFATSITCRVPDVPANEPVLRTHANGSGLRQRPRHLDFPRVAPLCGSARLLRLWAGSLRAQNPLKDRRDSAELVQDGLCDPLLTPHGLKRKDPLLRLGGRSASGEVPRYPRIYPRLSPATTWAYERCTPRHHELGVCVSGSGGKGDMLRFRANATGRPIPGALVTTHSTRWSLRALLAGLNSPDWVIFGPHAAAKLIPAHMTLARSSGGLYRHSTRRLVCHKRRNDPGPSQAGRGRFVHLGNCRGEDKRSLFTRSGDCTVHVTTSPWGRPAVRSGGVSGCGPLHVGGALRPSIGAAVSRQYSRLSTLTCVA